MQTEEQMILKLKIGAVVPSQQPFKTMGGRHEATRSSKDRKPYLSAVYSSYTSHRLENTCRGVHMQVRRMQIDPQLKSRQEDPLDDDGHVVQSMLLHNLTGVTRWVIDALGESGHRRSPKRPTPR